MQCLHKTASGLWARDSLYQPPGTLACDLCIATSLFIKISQSNNHR